MCRVAETPAPNAPYLSLPCHYTLICCDRCQANSVTVCLCHWCALCRVSGSVWSGWSGCTPRALTRHVPSNTRPRLNKFCRPPRVCLRCTNLPLAHSDASLSSLFHRACVLSCLWLYAPACCGVCGETRYPTASRHGYRIWPSCKDRLLPRFTPLAVSHTARYSVSLRSHTTVSSVHCTMSFYFGCVTTLACELCSPLISFITTNNTPS